MNDVVVFKTADDMRNGVGLSNVAQELIAKAFAFAGSLNEACDIDKGHRGRNNDLGIDEAVDDFKSGIGNLYNADIRIDRAEWVVRCFGMCSRARRESVKDSRF